MQNEPYLILDWDDTCMNTGELKERGFALLDTFFGPESARESYAQVRSSGYSFERHFDYLAASNLASEDERTIAKAEYCRLEDQMFSEVGSLLFEDAKAFLEKHRESGRLLILTIGNADFQKKKIDGAGFSDLEVVACKNDGKQEALTEWAHQKGLNPDELVFIFVDDKRENVEQLRKAFPHTVSIHIDRKSETSTLVSGEERYVEGEPIVNGFSDLEENLEHLGVHLEESKRLRKVVEEPALIPK